MAPRVEKYLHHRMYTDAAHRGLGLHSASWAGMFAHIQLVQKPLCLADHKMPSQTQDGHMTHLVESYNKILLSFGMEMGRLPRARSSAPRKASKRLRDEYDRLYEEQDSDDAHYHSLVPQRYLHSFQPKAGTSSLEANTSRNSHKWHQTGSPSETTWCTDGSLLQARAGTGLVNGKRRIKSRTPAHNQYIGQKRTGCGLLPPWPSRATRSCCTTRWSPGRSLMNSTSNHPTMTYIRPLTL